MNPKNLSPFFMLFIVLFLALALQGCNPANCGVPEYVASKFNDTNDGVCDADCSLREAVINSNVCPGAQIIRLPAGTYDLSIAGTGEDAAATGDLDITDDVTIIGMGAPFIDANGIDRVFDIHAPATVEIQTMLIRGGEEQSGAGIRNKSTLTMLGGVVANNTGVFPEGIMGGSSGGGIYSDGTLVLQGTQVRENSADMGGGIMIDDPGTLDMSTGSAMINGNIAHETGAGLAVAFGAEATLTGVDIWRNDAGFDGGGIFNAGLITMYQSNVYENTAGIEGGGLHNHFGGHTVGWDIRFEDNEAEQGGAILTTGYVTLYQSSISNNSATSGAGGAVYIDSAIPGLWLRNVTVSGNSASQAGSAGGIHNVGGDMLLEFITVAENSPLGIMNTAGGTLLIKSSIVASNAGGNCSGIGSSWGYNLDDGTSCNFTGSTDLSSTNPLLGPLANNGGFTLTHALLPGSPAIDTGVIDVCTAIDQRNVSRPQGTQCDRGAYEFEFPLTVITPIPITPFPLPTTTPTPPELMPIDLGGVEGRICYPSDFIPEMTLYFQNMDTNATAEFEHNSGEPHYNVNLFPGTYIAYAYVTGTDYGGAYTEYILCGGGPSCTDHTLVEFEVNLGQITSDIDICDYYGEPGFVPARPGVVEEVKALFIKNGFCRFGPGANYRDITALEKDEEVPVEGRSAADLPKWWWILLPTGGHCWVSDSVVEVTGPADRLPVIDAPAPPPGAPGRLVIADRLCNAKIYQVKLTWSDVSNETGYRIYRDGKLLATLGANTISYVDKPPYGGPYTYAVEAFNDSGTSAQTTVVEQGCSPPG